MGQNAFVWQEVLQPYIKSKQLLKCPSVEAVTSTYTYNANIGGISEPGVTTVGRNLASMQNVSRSLLMADGRGFPHEFNAENTPGWAYTVIIPDQFGGQSGRGVKYVTYVNGLIQTPPGGPAAETNWGASIARNRAGNIHSDVHMGGANYVFVDGHAKWIKSVGTYPIATGTALGTQLYAAPPKANMDYDSDGILGDDPTATPSTAGKWD